MSIVGLFSSIVTYFCLYTLSAVNGNGYRFDGGGPFYWDGHGSNGGVGKPRPMMSYACSPHSNVFNQFHSFNRLLAGWDYPESECLAHLVTPGSSIHRPIPSVLPIRAH